MPTGLPQARKHHCNPEIEILLRPTDKPLYSLFRKLVQNVLQIQALQIIYVKSFKELCYSVMIHRNDMSPMHTSKKDSQT